MYTYSKEWSFWAAHYIFRILIIIFYAITLFYTFCFQNLFQYYKINIFVCAHFIMTKYFICGLLLHYSFFKCLILWEKKYFVSLLIINYCLSVLPYLFFGFEQIHILNVFVYIFYNCELWKIIRKMFYVQNI